MKLTKAVFFIVSKLPATKGSWYFCWGALWLRFRYLKGEEGTTSPVFCSRDISIYIYPKCNPSIQNNIYEPMSSPHFLLNWHKTCLTASSSCCPTLILYHCLLLVKPSCALPKQLLVLIPVCNLYFLISLQPCYGTWPLLPFSDEGAPYLHFFLFFANFQY